MATVDPDRLRRSVAVIFQDFLHYALPAASRTSAWAATSGSATRRRSGAAVHVKADDFLAKLLSGYETVLGPEFEGGRSSRSASGSESPGQAFFRDALFIILDEPTAALDARAEHELFESIRPCAGAARCC